MKKMVKAIFRSQPPDITQAILQCPSKVQVGYSVSDFLDQHDKVLQFIEQYPTYDED